MIYRKFSLFLLCQIMVQALLRTLARVRKCYDNENELNRTVAGVVGLCRLDGQLLQQHLQLIPALKDNGLRNADRFMLPQYVQTINARQDSAVD